MKCSVDVSAIPKVKISVISYAEFEIQKHFTSLPIFTTEKMSQVKKLTNSNEDLAYMAHFLL